MPNPPAGWYDDPAGNPSLERFWDGNQWTQQTREIRVDPLPPPPPPPAADQIPPPPLSDPQPVEPSFGGRDEPSVGGPDEPAFTPAVTAIFPARDSSHDEDPEPPGGPDRPPGPDHGLAPSAPVPTGLDPSATEPFEDPSSGRGVDAPVPPPPGPGGPPGPLGDVTSLPGSAGAGDVDIPQPPAPGLGPSDPPPPGPAPGSLPASEPSDPPPPGPAPGGPPGLGDLPGLVERPEPDAGPTPSGPGRPPSIAGFDDLTGTDPSIDSPLPAPGPSDVLPPAPTASSILGEDLPPAPGRLSGESVPPPPAAGDAMPPAPGPGAILPPPPGGPSGLPPAPDVNEEFTPSAEASSGSSLLGDPARSLDSGKTLDPGGLLDQGGPADRDRSLDSPHSEPDVPIDDGQADRLPPAPGLDADLPPAPDADVIPGAPPPPDARPGAVGIPAPPPPGAAVAPPAIVPPAPAPSTPAPAIGVPPTPGPGPGIEAPLAATGSGIGGIRTELLSDQRYAEIGSAERVVRQNSRLLKVVLGDDVLARQGTMVAFQGSIDFDHEGTGGASKFIKKTFTGEGLPIMRCSGHGELFLAENARQVHIIHLDGSALTVNGRNVLAFEPSLTWDIERLKGAGMTAGGLYNTKLEGHGWVAITTDGDPVVLRTDAPTFADSDAAVAWSASLTATLNRTIKTKALIGRGSGEAVQLAFQGQGIVIVQPSEGPSVPPHSH